MTCEKTIKRYLNQENQDHLDLLVRIHVMRCPVCQAEIRMLQKEFSNIKNMNFFQPPYDLTENVMSRISTLDAFIPTTVFSSQWLIAGFVFISSIALVSFSETLAEMKNFFGSTLDFPLHLVFGLLITSYALLIAGVHLSQIKNFFSTILTKHRP